MSIELAEEAEELAPLPTYGSLVVAVDGSARSCGGLLTALSVARAWQVPVHVISVYDPYYHYAAFNRIARFLSDEAGKVFRFKEQEKLHEDIIDVAVIKFPTQWLIVLVKYTACPR